MSELENMLGTFKDYFIVADGLADKCETLADQCFGTHEIGTTDEAFRALNSIGNELQEMACQYREARAKLDA